MTSSSSASSLASSSCNRHYHNRDSSPSSSSSFVPSSWNSSRQAYHASHCSCSKFQYECSQQYWCHGHDSYYCYHICLFHGQAFRASSPCCHSSSSSLFWCLSFADFVFRPLTHGLLAFPSQLLEVLTIFRLSLRALARACLDKLARSPFTRHEMGSFKLVYVS